MIMTPMTRPAASTLNAPVSSCRPVAQDGALHELQCEEPVDHGRHPGEDLQQRLERFPRARPGELCEEDRGAEPERHRNEQGDHRCPQGRGDQRYDAEQSVGEPGCPPRAEQEVPHRDLGEEGKRRDKQRDQDSHRGHDGQHGCQAQRHLDDGFSRAAATGQAGAGPGGRGEPRTPGLVLDDGGHSRRGGIELNRARRVPPARS